MSAGAREDLTERAFEIPGVIEVREFMTGRENVYLEGVGASTGDITPVAKAVDELGLQVDSERLVRGDFTKPLTTSLGLTRARTADFGHSGI